MKKILVFLLFAAFLTVSSVVYGGYTVVGNGEKTVEDLLNGIYSDVFISTGSYINGSTASTVYTSNGGITATRLHDFGADSPVNMLTGTSANMDQTWTDGIAIATARAVFAGYTQEFGYNQNDSGYTKWFDVTSAPTFGYVDIASPTPLTFSPTWEWARSGNHPDEPWFSGDNVDGKDHMITYLITGGGYDDGKTTWLLFWDDQHVSSSCILHRTGTSMIWLLKYRPSLRSPLLAQWFLAASV